MSFRNKALKALRIKKRKILPHEHELIARVEQALREAFDLGVVSGMYEAAHIAHNWSGSAEDTIFEAADKKFDK